MTEPARRLSWIAGAAVIAFSVAIWVLARTQDPLEAPDLVPRPLASALLLSMPGLLGWIGAATGRRTVLVAAGILCLFQSAISFSGVTLIYLLPAIIFLRAATAAPERSGAEPPDSAPSRPIRVVVAAVISVPIALVVMLKVGLLGIILMALVAGLAASRREGRPVPRPSALEAARGAVMIVLVIGAWAASFVLTETTCWVGHAAAGGGVVWERIPPTDTLYAGAGDVLSSCSTGVVTPLGLAVAALLLVVAVALAAVPVRPGRPSAA
jgi:hypothetical protein